MFQYGTTSTDRLNTCHVDLQRLCNELIKHRDVSILCGHRGEKEQDAAFNSGNSNARWGESMHNTEPSLAVDMAPYHSDHPHIRWEDNAEFNEFSGFVKGVAAVMGINITWGGDFHSISDKPHWELV